MSEEKSVDPREMNALAQSMVNPELAVATNLAQLVTAVYHLINELGALRAFMANKAGNDGS